MTKNRLPIYLIQAQALLLGDPTTSLLRCWNGKHCKSWSDSFFRRLLWPIYVCLNIKRKNMVVTLIIKIKYSSDFHQTYPVMGKMLWMGAWCAWQVGFRINTINNHSVIFLSIIICFLFVMYILIETRKMDWSMSGLQAGHMNQEAVNLIGQACSIYFLQVATCCLLITFANSLDPDQDWQNVDPDLDPNCLTLWWYFWKNISKKFFLKKSVRRQQNRKNYPAFKEIKISSCKSVCLLQIRLEGRYFICDHVCLSEDLLTWSINDFVCWVPF